VDCEQVRDEFLSELVTGEGDRRPEPRGRHLEGCEGCRTELEELGRVWAALGQLPATEPGPDVGIRLMRRVRRQITREAVLTIRGWVPAVLAAVVGVTLSLGLAFLVPYSSLVFLCRQALQVSQPDVVAPYLLAGAAYGVPLALGASILRRRAPSEALIGGLEASVLFLLILAPFVIAECREFAPALRVAFVSGLGGGAVGSSLAALGLARLIPPRDRHAY
jgi:predicted anti-sigma-YlaC factor YlaD